MKAIGSRKMFPFVGNLLHSYFSQLNYDNASTECNLFPFIRPMEFSFLGTTSSIHHGQGLGKERTTEIPVFIVRHSCTQRDGWQVGCSNHFPTDVKVSLTFDRTTNTHINTSRVSLMRLLSFPPRPARLTYWDPGNRFKFQILKRATCANIC